MKSSNLRAHAVFLTILLVFCYFVGQSATTDINNLPESVLSCYPVKPQILRSCKPDSRHRLPTALAAAKLLKFRALHGETSLSSNEAEAFETILSTECLQPGRSLSRKTKPAAKRSNSRDHV